MEKLNDVLERARMMHKHLRPIMIDIGEIEAIAAAFRELEQRAEAAEAKLAELEKQEHYVEVMKDGPMTICHWMKPAEELSEGARLFTRPAPAVDLADLVPDKLTADGIVSMHDCGVVEGWNDCCGAMLRKIEETK